MCSRKIENCLMSALNQKRISSVFAVVAVCCFMLSGCIVIPVPINEDPYEETIPGLQPGITSKDQAIAQFGDPVEKYQQDSEFVYTALAESWKILWVGSRSGGLDTINSRHVLILSFDEENILTGFNVDKAGDNFGDCTKAGICLGESGNIMRYADVAKDTKAKEFLISNDQCGVYLHGPGSKNAFKVQMGIGFPNYMLSTSSFIFWSLDPGKYNIEISPVHVSMDIDCQRTEITYIHFDYSLMGASTIQIEGEVTGQKHIVDRRLILLPSGWNPRAIPPPLQFQR